MKCVLAFLTFCGAVLKVDGACALTDCTLGSSLTGSAGCTTYQAYIDCLTTAKGNCGSDTTNEGLIDVAITANTNLKNALSCGGATITCSISACNIGTSLTCAAYDTMLTCLNTAKGKCGSGDTITEGVIDAAITSNNAARNVLKCAGTAVSVSVLPLLLFAALAALFN